MFPILIIIAIVLLNVFATCIVSRCDLYNAGQKSVQIVLIWFIPVLASLVFIIFIRNDKRQALIHKPKEFYDNEDASGMDH